MKIVVCVKEVLDPEIAASIFQVDEKSKKVTPFPGSRYVMSPFDMQALELALRIRDTCGEVGITLLCLGGETARTMIKNGLSLGADDAILLIDSAFEDGDSYTTARALASAVGKIGDVDLVLTGRQAADGDCGVVGCGVAELLGVPAVTFAMDVTVIDGKLIIGRALGDCTETVEVLMPAVVTVSHEVGRVRHASLRETMKAARKLVTVWTADAIGLVASEVGTAGTRRVIERLYVPVNDTECEFITGDTPEELAANLISRLAGVTSI